MIEGLKIFWWVWTAFPITSLFYVGKQIQSKSITYSMNAIMLKNEPFLKVQEIYNSLELFKNNREDSHLDSLIFPVKRLSEKFSIESEFGCGNADVINCENDIARQIELLSDYLPYIAWRYR